MLLTFIELPAFASRWSKFGMTDNDLQALQAMLLKNPEVGNVISGTGGLRKVRFAPPSRHIGKSGAYRVGYAYFRVESTVYLMAIFAKSDQANLTASEKKEAKAAIESLANFFRRKG